jgi:ATP-dependent helicase/nuclease subunit A
VAKSTRMADLAARARALDPTASLIVQAPAGSGKTGLLTQRYLVLLARAEHPEEVVAITFTRKAANEMRERVLKALDEARTADRPETTYEAQTWDLARTVLERDIALQWHLALNPERLRIFTIDSFCSALTRQMPVLSRLGAPPSAADDPERLYRDAALAALAHLEENDTWSDSVARLLAHFDNDMVRARQQIADMLARRDQWMRHLLDQRSAGERRAHLESTLQAINRAALDVLARQAPATLSKEVAALARYAASNLSAQPDHPVHACASLVTWPGGALEQRSMWQGLAALLLTGKDEWFKTVNVKNGFPAATKKGGNKSENEQREAMKARMLAVLDQLRAGPPDFMAALAAVRRLPDDHYDDASWEAIEALTSVLRLAVGELTVAFKRSGRADFTEIAQGALHALGSSEEPTNLALHLDYRIHHLLVDEFQDTSISQFDLLERLTAGWQAGDGRTLFLVGDPMQSIYRFRQAEVGLYLRARHQGVGPVRLEPLTLSLNFRSASGVVDWVNEAFACILPENEDIHAGAVPYSPAVASKDAGDGLAVEMHPFIDDDGEAEARKVVELVSAARARQPDGRIAVLVRGRRHLAQIAIQLKEAGLFFQAVEIEALDERPVVQDLFALTRALTHPADRAAWLAVLRAPWCGLTLADLEALVTGDADQSVWNLMHDASRREQLSADGRTRLTRTRDALQPALAVVGHDRLRRVVEGAWLALGGGACVERQTDLEDARIYLELLDALDEAGTVPDYRQLTDRIDELFAQPDVLAPETLQLMTIHKAKGLEFDTVILPGLGRRPRNETPPLLRWLQTAEAAGSPGLLLAPTRATGADHGALYNYIGERETEKGHHENGRLLYVATTRARQHLHLLGSVKRKADGSLNAPASSTLLALLWPMVEDEFQQATGGAPAAGVLQPTSPPEGNLRRLPVDWTAPAFPPAVAWQAGTLPPLPDELPAVEFDWATETARHVGTVVHRALQQIGREGLAHWTVQRLNALLPGFRLALSRQGVPQDKLAEAAQRVNEAVAHALQDNRGAWLFDARHTQARSEYPLSFDDHGQLSTVIIDRTFIDNDGVRWIVDFKTGPHSGGGVEEFLDREQQRYRGQLEKYAAILKKLDSRPVKLGLYFPLLGGWREWEAE